ncbi:hypothetical protein PRUPE_8G103500 [Prunus persica]|uniref:Uncharacterized protein n=1 Tax=Prunus persica TaxID=3760 RepID=A0A251MW06_PRUPE|nr:hypothetical protein PRUPE_8G103500 [Prunus persica]
MIELIIHHTNLICRSNYFPSNSSLNLCQKSSEHSTLSISMTSKPHKQKSIDPKLTSSTKSVLTLLKQKWK